MWSANDRMCNAAGNLVTVHPAAGNGSDWLSLTNGVTAAYQTLGIEREVATIADATYTLTLDYAAALGLAQANTAIGVYVDGVKVGGYAGTSPNTALNWQGVSVQFSGNGLPRTVRIVLEGGNAITTARGAMVDDIRVIETLPSGNNTVYGLVNTAIALPVVQAAVTDLDGSEALMLEALGLPVGAVLSDGTRSVTVTASTGAIDLAGWALGTLSLKPAAGFTGSLQFTVRATSLEAGSTSSASVTQDITVIVLSGAPVATPAGINPFVSYVTASASQEAPVATDTIVVGPLVDAGGQLVIEVVAPVGRGRWDEEEESDREPNGELSPGWLSELEQQANAQWAQWMEPSP